MDGDQMPGGGAGIAMNRSGEFATSWLTGTGEGLVAVRHFLSSGEPRNEGTLLVKTNKPVENTSVGMSDDGSSIVAWLDGEANNVFALRENGRGTLTDSVFFVSYCTSYSYGKFCHSPAVAVDDEGNFCIGWSSDMRDTLGPWGYVQFFDNECNRLDTNLITGLRPLSIRAFSLAAAPGGGYVVFGTDLSQQDNDPEVCAVHYDSEGKRLGAKQQINQPDLFPYNHQITGYNAVAANDNRIVYVWLDNRRHKGFDVYAKIMDWNVPSVEEAPPFLESQIKLEASLNRLSYEVPGEATLTIYNSAGRKVEVEVIRDKGTWTPAELSSGVYFARVATGGFEVTKKTLVLR